MPRRIAGYAISYSPKPVRVILCEIAKIKSAAILSEMDRPEATGLSIRHFTKTETLFIHIPKTAGISWVKGLFDAEPIGHYTAENFLLYYGASKFDRMFKFSVCRHPLDRFISAYSFLASGGINQADENFFETVLSKYSGIEEFVMEGLDESVERQIHFLPQWRFIVDPRTNKICCDRLIYFEEIQQGFAEIANWLGRNPELPKLNKTKGQKSKNAVLSADAIEKLRKTYAVDTELLGYKWPNNG